MPFASRAQQRYLYAKKPKGVNLKEWSAKTDFTKLPEKKIKKASDLALALGALVLEKAASAEAREVGDLVVAGVLYPGMRAEKTAGFKSIGALADWLLKKGFRGAAKGLTHPLRNPGAYFHYGVQKPYKFLAQATGMNIPAEEAVLSSLIGKNPSLAKDWALINAHLKTRGIAPRLTLGKTLFSPMESLTPHLTTGGRQRWALEHLGDATNRAAALHGAAPEVGQAMERLFAGKVPHTSWGMKPGPAGSALGKTVEDVTVPEHLRRGMHSSLGAKLAPLGLFGLPVVAALNRGDPKERPVVTAPRRGLVDFPETPGPNAIQRLMAGIGKGVGRVSPGAGDWIQEHPYMSALGAGGLLGTGAYMGYKGLRGDRGDE